MEIRFDREGSVNSLESHLNELSDHPRVQSILLLACDDNGFTKQSLDPMLQSIDKPCFGGIFPQILHKGEHFTRGAVMVGLDTKAETAVVRELDNPGQDLDKALQDAFPGQDPDASTMFVFIDGLSSGIGGLLECLFNEFGLEIDYIGGGAGSLSLESRPCVISNEGLVQDGAVLAITDLRGSVGVAHGWQPITEALKVTESDGNRIVSLNWEPAFDVYRRIVEPHSAMSFASQAFFDIAKAYPFGIAKLDAEMVIRDPLMHEDGVLVCVGEVPQGAFVHIMHGNNATLIEAAGNALGLAQSDYPGARPGLMIFVDCISRVLFLGDDFKREIQAVMTDGIPMVGALTLGEIANNGREYLEFYNKTSVVGLLPG